MEAQGMSNDMEASNEVMESLGEAGDGGDVGGGSHESEGGGNANESLAIQKRLKQQRRSHEREIRELKSQIGDLHGRMQQGQPNMEASNPYGGDQPQGTANIDEHIRKAVGFALQQKDMAEQQARQAESQAHINGQHEELQNHLSDMGDKYDDFDDVVKGKSTPFTKDMATAAMILPRKGPGSAGEVLYKLGKNPDELKRISQLHPLDQATEMVKLSHALVSGGEQKGAASQRPLGQIKSNPVSNSQAVNEKTSVGELRRRMRANWK